MQYKGVSKTDKVNYSFFFNFFENIIQLFYSNILDSKVEKIIYTGLNTQMLFNNEYKEDKCVDYLKNYDSEAYLRQDQKLE